MKHICSIENDVMYLDIHVAEVYNLVSYFKPVPVPRSPQVLNCSAIQLVTKSNMGTEYENASVRVLGCITNLGWNTTLRMTLKVF